MAVVIHKTRRVPYLYLGENKFRNLHTGQEGVVTDEQAREVFAINLPLTGLVEEYPLVGKLISVLELRIESNK